MNTNPDKLEKALKSLQAIHGMLVELGGEIDLQRQLSRLRSGKEAAQVRVQARQEEEDIKHWPQFAKYRRVLQMRRAGMSYQQIGEEFGVLRQSAFNLYTSALWAKHTDEWHRWRAAGYPTEKET